MNTTGREFSVTLARENWVTLDKNTNGLIQQYLPNGQSMALLTQHDCNAIARRLNQRPRKRLGFRTPEELRKGCAI